MKPMRPSAKRYEYVSVAILTAMLFALIVFAWSVAALQ
jgi:hypothetical protein